MVKFSKSVLYMITGAFLYWVCFGIPFSALLERICPIEHIQHNSVCASVNVVILAVAFFGLVSGISIREFHRVGKWFWLKLMPAWAS
jgi:hypothetical protein